MINRHQNKHELIKSLMSAICEYSLPNNSFEVDEIDPRQACINIQDKTIAIESYLNKFCSVNKNLEHSFIRLQGKDMFDSLLTLRSCESLDFLRKYDAVSIPLNNDSLCSVVLCISNESVLSIALVSGWDIQVDFYATIPLFNLEDSKFYFSTNSYRELLDPKRHGAQIDLLSDSIFIGLDLLYKRALCSPASLEPCIHFRNQHIGHFYWNDLCGLFNMKNNSKNTDFIVSSNPTVLAEYQFLLSEFYFSHLRDKLLISLDRNSIISYLYENPHKFIFASINNKVNLPPNSSWTTNQSPTEKSKYPNTSDHKICIVVNIRLRNRYLLNQVECLASYLNSILSTGASLNIFFTGLNKEGDMHTYSDGSLLIEEETQVANQIINSLVTKPGDRLYYKILIGCSLQEELSVLDSLEQKPICIAPWGAGLCKYMWMRRYPCFIYSNSKMLENNNGHLIIYNDPNLVEYPSVVKFIAPEHVKDIDIPNEFSEDWSRENFYIDPIVFMHESLEFTSHFANLIPEDFDWQFYLEYHKDLQQASINDEQKAKQHYLLFGRNENRRYKEAHGL